MENLFETKGLSEELQTFQIINSSLIPKLILCIEFGFEGLVEKSIVLLKTLINLCQSTNQLIEHVLNCNLFYVIIKRSDDIKWKISKIDFKSLKQTEDKRLIDSNHNKTNISFVGKKLFLMFSDFVKMLSIFMNDLLKTQFIPYLIRILNRFICCPITKIIVNAIDTLSQLFQNNNPNIDLILIDNFSQTLFALTDNSNNNSIINTILQLFNTILCFKPNLVIYKNFGKDLLICLNKIVNQNRDNIIDKTLISVISSIGEDIDSNNELIRNYFYKVCDQLLYLLSILFESNDRQNRILSSFAFKAIFLRYSFERFINLLKCFDLKRFLENLLKNNEFESQKIGLEVIDHILNTISEIPNLSPIEMNAIKSNVFSRQTNIKYILEELMFETNNQILSNVTNYLIERIDN